MTFLLYLGKVMLCSGILLALFTQQAFSSLQPVLFTGYPVGFDHITIFQDTGFEPIAKRCNPGGIPNH
jgi:hypothetical protein